MKRYDRVCPCSQYVSMSIVVEVRRQCFVPRPLCTGYTPFAMTFTSNLCLCAQMNVDENPVDDFLHSSSVEFDASTLSLTFRAAVEYVGNSTDGNFNHDFNLGVCRWMRMDAAAECAVNVLAL